MRGLRVRENNRFVATGGKPMTATPKPHPWIAGMLGACALLASTDAQAQLDENTQALDLENAGIAKSSAQPSTTRSE